MTKKRFNNLRVVFTLFVMLALSGLIQAGISLDEKAEIPLTNPSKISDIEVRVVMGSIFVTGYSGKTILVETKKALKDKNKDNIDVDVDLNNDQDEKSKGMFVIDNDSSGLSVIEENNKVIIRTRRFNTGRDFIKPSLTKELSV